MVGSFDDIGCKMKCLPELILAQEILTDASEEAGNALDDTTTFAAKEILAPVDRHLSLALSEVRAAIELLEGE